MSAVPMKPEFGPTLGRLLAPRWRSTSGAVRAAVIGAGVGVVLLAIGVVLTLEKAHYSHGHGFPFSFSYRDLYRTAPDQGGYVKLVRRAADGKIAYSYAVGPLQLPSYSGEISGVLPIYAAGYVDQLQDRYSHFVLNGESRTRVDKIPGYEVLFTADVQGQRMYGRYVLLTPEQPGVRRGVKIEMLASTTASSQIKSPTEVASSGPLVNPLKTFAFG
jgi:hypothetical protein